MLFSVVAATGNPLKSLLTATGKQLPYSPKSTVEYPVHWSLFVKEKEKQGGEEDEDKSSVRRKDKTE